jgi:hypothetical protein
MYFLSKRYLFKHWIIFKFTKKNFLQVSDTNYQPPWLRMMDQIAKTKRLTNYPKHKLCLWATWIFWNIINNTIYEKLIKKSLIFLLKLVYQCLQSPSNTDNQNTPEMGYVMALSTFVGTFVPLKLQQLFNKKKRLCSNLIAWVNMVFLLAHGLNETTKFRLGVFQLHECN